MKVITKSVIRKISKMKWRTIAISLVIATAMGMFIAGFYGSSVMDASVNSYFEDTKMADLFIEFNDNINESDIDNTLANSSSVSEYDLRSKKLGTYDHEGEDITTIFIGVRDPGNEDINKLTLESGRMFSSAGEAVAISGMEDNGIKKNAELEFQISGKNIKLNLTGTIQSPEYIFTSDYTDYSIPVTGSLIVIYMDLDELQSITGPGVNDVVVILSRGGSEDTVITELDQYGIRSTTTQDAHPSVKFMNIGSSKLKNMFPLMGVIFMIVGFISIFMTMIRLVQNDSRYLGVLMAHGYTKRDITTSYLIMGLIITAIGVVLGIIFGILFAWSFVDIGTSLYFNVDIVFPFDPVPFILGILYSVGVVMLSVWIPVRLITGASVRDALEYKPRTKVHTSKVMSSKFSRVSMLGLRNATRNPGRMAVTVFVVALTIGIAGSWLVMTDSAFGYMMDQLEADTWDLRADFASPVSSDLVNESFVGINEDDTEYLIPFSYVAGEAKSKDGGEGAVFMGCDQWSRVKDFELREGKLDFDNAVITNKLADDLGVTRGDTVKLVLGSIEVDLEVSGVVFDVLINTVYTNRANLNDLFPETQSSGAFIKLTEPSSAGSLAKEIRNEEAVSKVVVHSDITETFDEILEMAVGFLYAFFFFSIIITIVVAGAAVILSTMERDVEFATLDTLGISRWKVIKSILIEMGILGALSAAIGIPFAYLFAKIMAVLLEDVIFYFPVVLVLGSSIIIFVIGIAFVLLSSAVPIRYTAKLDTEMTIRERTAG